LKNGDFFIKVPDRTPRKPMCFLGFPPASHDNPMCFSGFPPARKPRKHNLENGDFLLKFPTGRHESQCAFLVSSPQAPITQCAFLGFRLPASHENTISKMVTFYLSSRPDATKANVLSWFPARKPR
jgi:hypothetical protein